MKYSVEMTEKYRQAWNEHTEEIKRNNESRRQEALQCARKLAGMLVERFGAKKVGLFGSVIHKTRFDKDSDIDIAVEGITPEKYFRAAAECQSAGFPVDLVDVATTTQLMKERISRGTVLYEQK
jgi:predicted nucleotidyltransferase